MSDPVPPEQTKLTVTFLLFQPAAFGGGVAVAAIASGLALLLTSKLTVLENALCSSPRKAAETLKPIRPAAGSLTLKTSVRMLSPATVSPLRPSSCSVPRVAIAFPLESKRRRLTLPAINEGSVIKTVTFTCVGVLAGTTVGLRVTGPISGCPQRAVASKKGIALPTSADAGGLPCLMAGEAF